MSRSVCGGALARIPCDECGGPAGFRILGQEQRTGIIPRFQGRKGAGRHGERITSKPRFSRIVRTTLNWRRLGVC
jgi:hypothetical protein